jgi:D-glycero-beta-D-manno-heptose 1-phosphate adenylyltransferase
LAARAIRQDRALPASLRCQLRGDHECPYCGVPLDDGAQLDHIDPVRGEASHCTLERVGRLYSREELAEQRRRWKQEGRIVVFTNGCYDLLHPGHIRLLEQARSLGDVLILALNSDASVRRMKGPGRPLLDEAERSEMAMALEAVDAVTLFDEDTPRELIAEVLPDVLVKGADWSHFVAGREEVEAAGGRVLTVALETGYSTTNIVELILSHQP